jgi:hypothetical protein
VRSGRGRLGQMMDTGIRFGGHGKDEQDKLQGISREDAIHLRRSRTAAEGRVSHGDAEDHQDGEEVSEQADDGEPPAQGADGAGADVWGGGEAASETGLGEVGLPVCGGAARGAGADTEGPRGARARGRGCRAAALGLQRLDAGTDAARGASSRPSAPSATRASRWAATS